MIHIIIWNKYLWKVGRETVIDLPDLCQELGHEARLYLSEICIDLCSTESSHGKQMLPHVFTRQSTCREE